MRFHISRNNKGAPVHVNTDNGFMQVSRAFNPEQDAYRKASGFS